MKTHTLNWYTDMTVYLFFISYDNSLYAYTIDKEYRDKFKEQRNMDIFTIEKMDIYENEIPIFLSIYQKKQIIKDFLYDGNQDMEIMCTIDESDVLSSYCEYISTLCESIKNQLPHMNLKDKWLELISSVTDDLTSGKSLQINTFKVFYEKFKFTFIKEELKNE